jgi:transposase
VGSGRPRKTTPEEEENIALAVAAKPITTAQEIAGKFKS